MSIPQDKFNSMFKKVPEQYRNNLYDYMEYLIQKSVREQWHKFPKVNEPLNDEEKQQLGEKREYLIGEQAKDEFDFPINLP